MHAPGVMAGLTTTPCSRDLAGLVQAAARRAALAAAAASARSAVGALALVVVELTRPIAASRVAAWSDAAALLRPIVGESLLPLAARADPRNDVRAGRPAAWPRPSDAVDAVIAAVVERRGADLATLPSSPPAQSVISLRNAYTDALPLSSSSVNALDSPSLRPVEHVVSAAGTARAELERTDLVAERSLLDAVMSRFRVEERQDEERAARNAALELLGSQPQPGDPNNFDAARGASVQPAAPRTSLLRSPHTRRGMSATTRARHEAALEFTLRCAPRSDRCLLV